MASVKTKIVDLINKLDHNSFKKLLEKLLAKLPCQITKSNDLFTLDERDKLMKIFDLSSTELTLILQFCCETFQKSAYDLTKPDVLQENLRSQGFNNEIVGVIIETYSGVLGKDFVNRLKSMSTAEAQLVEFNHILNVEVASSDRSKINKPTACLQFSLSNQNCQQKSVSVELDHQQLYDFYNKLEDVQNHLDSIMG